MQRFEVLQPLINLFKDPKYLEIGVEGGITFHLVKAAKKIAVDPIFRFDVPEPRITDSVEYHEVTSDAYFGSLKRSDKFDVIFVDGLHTNEQTLRDLLNAIEHLSEDGVVVIDDVLPSSYAASLDVQADAEFFRNTVNRERFDGDNWMGPVYRVVYFIATFMQSFRYATITENHGQTILWRSIRPSPDGEDRTLESIARLSFIEMLHSMEVMNIMPYADILAEIRQSR